MECPFCRTRLTLLSDPRFAICKSDLITLNLAYAAANYENDYFDREYKTQYGKSYTADHEAILARNAWRYEHLKNFISPETHPRVLEVGSAAGYFLKIMQEEEYTVSGWEISKAMSKYANARGLKTLRHDFMKGARLHEKKKSPAFDVVALFYVLEHLPDQAAVWHHLARLVRKGGHLALALPSSGGPTFRFRRDDWFSTHPQDHAIDYSPAALDLVGKRYGFTLRGAWSEGIHPERFPLGANKIMGSIYRRLIVKRPIGDTIFAVLERAG